MYPILYRKKTRIRFYLCLLGAALCLRLLCAPDLRETARREARELLSRSELLRGVVFLETGMRTTEAFPIESTDNAASRDEQCSSADEQPDPAARRDEQCSSADKQPGADNADKQCLSLPSGSERPNAPEIAPFTPEYNSRVSVCQHNFIEKQ